MSEKHFFVVAARVLKPTSHFPNPDAHQGRRRLSQRWTADDDHNYGSCTLTRVAYFDILTFDMGTHLI